MLQAAHKKGSPQSEGVFPWETPIQYVKGVGPTRAILFGKLGVSTLEDLFYFFPFRYEDRTALNKIASLIPGEEQTILGEVKAVSLVDTPRRRMKIVDVALLDETGLLHAKWFNQAYLKQYFKVGDKVMLSGRTKANAYSGGRLEMESPQYEKLDDNEPQIHTGRIVPIYHETKGLTSRQIRSLVMAALNRYAEMLPEMLPPALIRKYKFLSLPEAIRNLHFPPEAGDVDLFNSGESLPHKRLSFDELFLLQIGLALRKKLRTEEECGLAFSRPSPSLAQLRDLIPFTLTGAQERVLSQIRKDMAVTKPMNRLIQGDVGSGKTMVALMAILVALDHGCQAAFMAPTEILAGQHFQTIRTYLETLGKSVVLLTSDMKKKEKDAVLLQIKSGESDLVIGTHALIQEGVHFKKLGLTVVDEQHKFGVLQRAKLRQKGVLPDMLIMTATPIPRTLGMTLYGDLDITVIDELPPGRPPVRTTLLYGKKRDHAYQLLEEELKKGRQGYIVCPLVVESEKVDLRAATELYNELKKGHFRHRRIGLLHGRLKKDEKELIMRDFKEGLLDLLIATTVVEVGIDVPNATIMLIEHVERFGLAQLHQLRGRVGRGSEQSSCLMLSAFPLSKEGKRRLEAMVRSNDGFKIAEVDLAIRGPGEFFGTRQSGLPVLRVANLIRDVRVLEAARKDAFEWLDLHPRLEDAESRPIRSFMERKWRGKLEWLTTA